MKTPKLNRRSEEGSVLLVSLIVSAILGITLASYLLMTEAQNVSVARSQVWNSSMVLTEAGVEDALAMINVNAGGLNLEAWTNAAAANGWVSLGNNVYKVERTVSVNNWGSNYYVAYITNGTSPTVTATGFAPWKQALYSSTRGSHSTFAAAGSPNTSGAEPMTQASRKIVVQTAKDSSAVIAMAALDKIDFNGNNVTTDSFDSTPGSGFNLNGNYNSGMIKSNGDVSTTSTIINSINVGNANIKGKAKTGPNGTVSVGPNGYVTGGIYNDFNVSFPSASVPSDFSGGGLIYNNITVNGTTYSRAITTSGDYILTSLPGSLYVASNITVRIKITGTVNLTGNSEIRFASGSTVSLYMAGSSFSVKGNGIINENGNAASLTYYGLPSNTSITFGGNGGFTGSIYAPQADFSLGGGGNNTTDFIGSSVTKSVKMNGHFNFHYDEALRKTSPSRGYIPVNWKEVATN